MNKYTKYCKVLHQYCWLQCYIKTSLHRYRATWAEGVDIWAGWGSAAEMCFWCSNQHQARPACTTLSAAPLLRFSVKFSSSCSLSSHPLPTRHAKADIFLIASCKSCYFSLCSPHLLFFIFYFFTSPLCWFLPCFWLVAPFSFCPISFVLSNGSLGSFPQYSASRFSFHPSSHLFCFTLLYIHCSFFISFSCSHFQNENLCMEWNPDCMTFCLLDITKMCTKITLGVQRFTNDKIQITIQGWRYKSHFESCSTTKANDLEFSIQ